MSFAQMREKLTDGAYPTWTAVQTDLETMFNNAMIFNGPATQYHQKVGPHSEHLCLVPYTILA